MMVTTEAEESSALLCFPTVSFEEFFSILVHAITSDMAWLTVTSFEGYIRAGIMK